MKPLTALLIIISIHLFSSAAFSQDSLEKEEAKIYYKTLLKELTGFSTKIVALGNYLEECKSETNQCYEKLNQQKFDSVIVMYDECSRLISNAVFNVLTLPEVDSASGLKFIVLDILRTMNSSLSEFMPKLLALFKDGFKNYNEQQITAYKKADAANIAKMQAVAKLTDSFGFAFTKFLNRFNLTEYEILKGGL